MTFVAPDLHLQPLSPLRDLARYIGTHTAPGGREHERDRARQRLVGCVAVGCVWAADALAGQMTPARAFLVAMDCFYSSATLTYLLLLRRDRAHDAAPVYAFLLGDPLFLTVILALDPHNFAFMNPFLFVVIVQTGIRYGVRTMYLSWATTTVASAMLLATPFWTEKVELTLAFFLMLTLVPAFFTSLIRKIHGARTVEEERARLAAKSEAILARSSFLAKVSHELRSPLQGIVSALDVLALRQGPKASEEDELIHRIRRSSLLLNTHLRDLLTLAKGEAGHLELRPEPFDAAALVESVAASALDLAGDKKLELIVEIPPEAVFVIADGARIDQILTNLVINSIRYTEVGHARIALRRYSVNDRMLEFVVSDTGPGIPESMLPTLLSPDRTVSTSARRGEGSGIGLAIVRTLVDHLGGTVEVTSRVGGGTTFTIAVPAEPVAVDEREEEHQSATGRVLIVDDDDDIADALVSVVDELGFECERASSVATAANALASRRYDAAVVDVEMPGRGGVELAGETRRGSGPNAHTRFVGVSAGDPDGEVRSMFDAWLRKPIDRASLRRALLGPGMGVRPSQPGLWLDAGD